MPTNPLPSSTSEAGSGFVVEGSCPSSGYCSSVIDWLPKQLGSYGPLLGAPFVVTSVVVQLYGSPFTPRTAQSFGFTFPALDVKILNVKVADSPLLSPEPLTPRV